MACLLGYSQSGVIMVKRQDDPREKYIPFSIYRLAVLRRLAVIYAAFLVP